MVSIQQVNPCLPPAVLDFVDDADFVEFSSHVFPHDSFKVGYGGNSYCLEFQACIRVGK